VCSNEVLEQRAEACQDKEKAILILKQSSIRLSRALQSGEPGRNSRATFVNQCIIVTDFNTVPHIAIRYSFASPTVACLRLASHSRCRLTGLAASENFVALGLAAADGAEGQA